MSYLNSESNQKIYNDLFIIDANEFYILYTKFKEMLAKLSKNMSKAVLKQETSEQKSQIDYYE